MQKYKKRRNIWLVSTIGTAGLGLYSHIKANNLYDEYLDATTNASDLHQKIETYDKIKPIAFTAAGICLVEFFIQNSKYKKAKQKVKIYPSYSQNGGAISLRYKF